MGSGGTDVAGGALGASAGLWRPLTGIEATRAVTASIRSFERMIRPGCRFRFLGPMKYAIAPERPPLSEVISSNRTLESHRLPF